MAFRPQLQEYKSVGDPIMSGDFYLLIPTIPGSSDSRRMSYKIVSTNLPGSQIEQMQLEIGARRFNFAGRRTYSGSWNSTIIETADATTRADLLGWMNICRPYANGNGTYRNEYAQRAELRVYDAANNLAISQTILALFPLSVDDADLSQGSNILQYNVTWSFDEVIETYGGG